MAKLLLEGFVAMPHVREILTLVYAALACN
jgi:hypothetical protein